MCTSSPQGKEPSNRALQLYPGNPPEARGLFGVGRKTPTPTVEVTRPLLEAMTREVLAHPNIETSWGIYGLINPDGSVIACGFMPPTVTTVRNHTTTQFGDELSGKILQWMMLNYTQMQNHGTVPEGPRLDTLFKGHSHHRLGLRQYSGTDIASITDFINMGMQVAIGPLANIDHYDSEVHLDRRSDAIKVTKSAGVSFRFYYYSQEMKRAGQRDPITVQPVIRESNPILPPLSWHLARPDFYQRQLQLLTEFGCQIETQLVRDGGPLLKLRLLLDKPGWPGQVSIVTAHDFPASPPLITLWDGSVLGEWFNYRPVWRPHFDLVDPLSLIE